MSDIVERSFLLLKRGLYWRPDSLGYTGLKREAGRYSEQQARFLACEGEVSDAAACEYYTGVYMIAEETAPRFAPKCFEDIKERELEAENAALRTRLAEVEKVVSETSGMLDASIKRHRVREDQEPVTLILNGERLGTFTYAEVLDRADVWLGAARAWKEAH